VTNLLVGNALIFCFACAGGVVGYLGFGLLLDQGFYLFAG
jgi:hypothetical protein